MSNTETSTASSSESMSAAESAYFESGGSITEGLDLDLGTETANPAPMDARQVDQAGAPDDDDALDDVTVGPDGRPRDSGGKFVPHEALHKERSKRKALETENLTMREKMARADERLNVLNELMKAPDPSSAPGKSEPAKNPLEEDAIDPEQDIFAAFKQVQRQNAELSRLVKDREASEKASQTSNSVANAYRDDARAFVSKTPDFKDAYVHLIGSMHKELEAFGMSDPAERNRAIAEQEKQFVQMAMANKKSPSELLYAVAKTRGFNGPQQPAVQNDSRGKLENVKRAQNAVVSLSNAGGNSGEGLTMETLANMNEDEFARVTSKLSKGQLRALMGG